MFTEKDLEQIHNKGITIDQVNAQISRLKNGMSFSNLVAAATVGKGIETYNEDEKKLLIDLYDTKKEALSIIKFVPASGAATRMFKFLFQFLKSFNPSKESIKEYAERKNDALIEKFATDLKNFPFYNQTLEKAKLINSAFEALPEDEKCLEFVKIMLDKDGLNYSFLPKGLLPFHKYQDKAII